MPRLAAAAGAALVVFALAVPAAGASGGVLYRFTDPRLDEASGLAVGVRSPGVDYVQNDSGDTARFFAVEAATGRTAAVVSVPGATNVDWEDLAVAPAPGAAGRSSVWLADTGDNGAARAEVRVYRVDEPRVAPGNRSLPTGRPDVWRLRYPGGPVDAESLAVAPDGTAYLVTKSLTGVSVVYRLPLRPDAGRVQALTRVGSVTFHAHAWDGPLGALGTVTATGAAFSRDGTLLVVRTYADAFVWRVDGGDVAGALRRAPVRVVLPVQRQGEGVAVDGQRLLVDSEGLRAPVYAVPLPAAVLPRAPAATSPSAASATPRAASTRRAPRPSHAWVLVGGVGTLAIVLAGTVIVRRRRAR